MNHYVDAFQYTLEHQYGVKPTVAVHAMLNREPKPIGPGSVSFANLPSEYKRGLVFYPQDLLKKLRRYYRKRAQKDFDQRIRDMRRAGLTCQANRVIILDMVKGWPRRNGLTI